MCLIFKLTCCLFIFNFTLTFCKEPKKIMDVTLLSDPPENSLTVSWSPVTCDTKTEKNAYIHSYKVIYCKLDSQNNCKGNWILLKGKIYIFRRWNKKWFKCKRNVQIQWNSTMTEFTYHLHTMNWRKCFNWSSDVFIGEESSTRVLASGLPQQTIQKLDPDNNYGIWVQASSLSKDGPKSAMLTGRPTNNGINSNLTLTKYSYRYEEQRLILHLQK